MRRWMAGLTAEDLGKEEMEYLDSKKILARK